MRDAETQPPYVSRGGLKLEHALREFGVDVAGLTCADLGCSTGGFTDCLLRHGATRVYSVDTGYGVLAWRLRNDARVTVMERTSALHAEPPQPVDLVVIDMGWTPQHLCIPAALGWLKPDGRIITLIKPHYELSARNPHALPRGGVLNEGAAEKEMARVVDALPSLGVVVFSTTRSPVLGSRAKRKGKGNVEFLALLKPAEALRRHTT